MGKKKVQVNLNNLGPLEATSIGEIKPPKHVGIKVFILLAFFVAVVFFLPEIKVYLDKYILGQSNSDNTIEPAIQKEEDEEDEDDETSDIEVYSYEENTELDLSEEYSLNLSNIKFENDILTFDMLASDEDVDLSEDTLYLVLYNSDSLAINYYRLNDKLDSTNVKSKSFNAAGTVSFSVNRMSEEDYPIYDAREDENGNSYLTCANDIENFEYKFVDGELTEVKLSALLDKTDSDQYNLALIYKDIYNNYSNKAGYTVIYEDASEENKLNVSVKVNYLEAIDIIKNEAFYKKGVKLNTVKFEMESVLYKCR